MKRIEKTAPASTDPAYHPAWLPIRQGRRRDFRWVTCLDRRQPRRHPHPATSQRGSGTLIRHARLGLPLAVVALAIPMIEPPLLTSLMAAVGLAALLAAGFLAATRTAIPLPAVTMTAEIKDRTATRETTNPLVEYSLAGVGHRFPEAELDNRRPSWQDTLTVGWRSWIGPPIKNPGCSNNRGFLFPSWGTHPIISCRPPKTPAAMMLTQTQITGSCLNKYIFPCVLTFRIVSMKKVGWSMQNSSESTPGTNVEQSKGKVKKARRKSRKKR
jgi:hypothetical protein